MKGTNTEILDRLTSEYGNNAKAADGVKRLREVLDVARVSGIPEERLRLDLSIARGLDYYTGTIYETFLLDLPKIGSVCSGGRYDNLAALYTKQRLPGVGASLGLDRLLEAMEDAESVAENGDDGASSGGAVQRRPSRRLSKDGAAASRGGNRRRGLSRSEEGRPTT